MTGAANSRGEQLARAAVQLIGIPYRLHGRDPATGLDCVGVLAASLDSIRQHWALPTGYTLRNRAFPGISAIASDCGFAEIQGKILAGDVLSVRPHACQLHFLISIAQDRYVHAHAGLRRVALTPWVPEWTLERHFRLSGQT